MIKSIESMNQYMAEREGFEHDSQQSGLQLADSILPRWLSMPSLPWLLGPYWPMVEIRTSVPYAAVVGSNRRASSQLFPMRVLRTDLKRARKESWGSQFFQPRAR